MLNFILMIIGFITIIFGFVSIFSQVFLHENLKIKGDFFFKAGYGLNTPLNP